MSTVAKAPLVAVLQNIYFVSVMRLSFSLKCGSHERVADTLSMSGERRGASTLWRMTQRCFSSLPPRQPDKTKTNLWELGSGQVWKKKVIAEMMMKCLHERERERRENSFSTMKLVVNEPAPITYIPPCQEWYRVETPYNVIFSQFQFPRTEETLPLVRASFRRQELLHSTVRT